MQEIPYWINPCLLYTSKVKNNEVTAVIRQGLNEDWNVYAMYSYKTEKTLPRCV